MNKVYDNWPPTLTEQQLRELKEHAVDYALSHGLVMKNKDLKSIQHAPVALFPSPFPQPAFDYAYEVQPFWNKLVDVISQDHEFLCGIFSKLAAADPFQAKLFQIYKECYDLQQGVQSHTQTVRIGIHRSDYMLHQSSASDSSPIVQQVELNTIASSFSSLSSLTRDLHQYLSHRTGYFNDQDVSTMNIYASSMPRNQSLESVAAGLAMAHQLYKNSKAAVLFVVQPNERNIFDQRWIEYQLMEVHHIKVLRRTFSELIKQCQVDSKSNTLLVDGIECAVVYYRAGYVPHDYLTDKEWNVRLQIEKSMAIKCPNIAYHLVGAKKVQQVLAQPGVLERFLAPSQSADNNENIVHSVKEIDQLRRCFTGIYSLDADEDGDRNAQMALNAGSDQQFVLKPQLEGGGNNFYGPDVKTQLAKMSRSERSGYILMQMIQPPPYRNVLLKDGELMERDVVCELGVYGIFIKSGGADNKIHLNQAGGHLLRTKASDSNEGGVAAGFAVIDNPTLF
ncbi:hypothetical protein MP228_012802 [Amoeboaphelidium protococcarum]|nr:hypothetical protein MP228_012802 [Amoeboaphelidium protococcarum]